MYGPFLGGIISFLVFLFSAFPCAAEGALATGQNGSGGHWLGVSSNNSTVQGARDGAMNQCLARGPNCNIVQPFRMGCVAIVFGRLPDGRSGYEWAIRASEPDARAAVMASCQNRGGYCELKGVHCDAIDEAQGAAQARIAEQQAAQEAQRRREEAEAAAARARADAEAATERARQAEADARRREARAKADTRGAETPSPGSVSILASMAPGTAIGLGVIALLAVLGIAVKRDLPNGARAFIAIGTPVISGVILYGMGIKDEIPLYELPLLSLPFGGALIAALIYKTHT